MSVNRKSDRLLNLKSCRICMDSQSLSSVPLNDENGLLTLFEYCFGLKLLSRDQPRVLCQECADNVKCYAKFKKKCHKSDTFWKSLYKENCHIEVDNNDKFDELSGNDNDVSNNSVLSEELDDESDENVIDAELLANYPSNVHNYAKYNKKDRVGNEQLSDTENSELKKILCAKPVIKSNDSEVVQSSPNTKKDVNDLFSCLKCQKKYASNFWYRRHLKLCISKKIKTSVDCQNADVNSETATKNTQAASESNENMFEEKSQGNMYYCGVCTYSSNYIDCLNEHLNQHWANNTLHCMVCDYVGKDQAALAAHRYTHYAIKASVYLCHICKHKARSQLTLQFHYRKVHLNKIGGLCSEPKCNKVFNSWRHWKSHEKIHKNPGYECDICGQKYRHKHLIVEHMIIHMNPPTHVCDVCGKTFLRLRNLKVHIENVHAKPNPIKCTHCNRMFKTEYYLRNHLRIEAMDKKWKCELCDMEYPILSALKNHMTTHSDERPHCCDICGSRYKRKEQLVVHLRKHTGYRPFRCMLCSKTFTTKGLLKNHSIIHTGILPYKCQHCEKTFRCKQRMLKHCTISHNNNLEK